MDPTELTDVIEEYVRPRTYPIGFKFVNDPDDYPGRVGQIDDITICQGYGLARFYGWTMHVDIRTSCPIGLVAYGFAEGDEMYEGGELADQAGYAESAELGKTFEEAVPKKEFGEHEGCVIGPLHDMAETPDFAAVYGTPAQILRMIHAVLHTEGGSFDTSILGRAACSELLEAYLTDEPQFVFPCYGERLFGLTQDDEVAFSFPYEQADTIAENLATTHEQGLRYPIPAAALRTHVPLPESYEQSAAAMKGSAEGD